MESYILSECVSDPMPTPFPEEVVKDAAVMNVNENSKIRGLVNAMHKHKQQGKQRFLIHGEGDACSRVISCAEVFKRECDHKQALHQSTKLAYRNHKDVWTGKDTQLDVLNANKETPNIFILLSLTEIEFHSSSADVDFEVEQVKQNNKKRGNNNYQNNYTADNRFRRKDPKSKRDDRNKEIHATQG